MSVSRKSRPEPELLPPIDFHPPSNGEFCPVPPPRRAIEAKQRWLQMVEEKHKRLGMTRREFANSACGMAAALLAINQAACSSGDGRAGAMGDGTSSGGCGPIGCGMNGGAAGTNAGAGISGGGAGMNAGGVSGMSGAGMTGGAAGMGGSGIGGMGGMNAGAGGYMVDDDMTEDEDKADDMMNGDDFIFDVQTHTSTDLERPWDGSPDERALEYITQIFVMSETSVAVLSGAPNTRNLGAPNIASRDQMKEIIDRLAGSPRLLIHGNLELERGSEELDYMEELAEAYNPSAWKTYPHSGDQLLDSDEYGAPFVERAIALGIPMLATHRGLWDNGGYTAKSSPADVVRAAKAAPDMKFLIYHSGYEKMTDESHPFDPDAADHYGVDRLIKALQDSGMGPDGNVYAELGTTWVNVMNDPMQAGHLLGKLLLALGPDRILFGTDCLYNGNPQSQITALRMFQIPDQLQQEFGYPALTPEIKRKIFGLNAASIYGIDVNATRAAISADDVNDLRMAFLHDPRSVPTPDRRRFEGPRTRRQFLKLLEHERLMRYG